MKPLLIVESEKILQELYCKNIGPFSGRVHYTKCIIDFCDEIPPKVSNVGFTNEFDYLCTYKKDYSFITQNGDKVKYVGVWTDQSLHIENNTYHCYVDHIEILA